MNSQEIHKRIEDARERYVERSYQKKSIEAYIDSIKAENHEEYEKQEKLEVLLSLFNQTAQYARQDTKEQIEKLISECLRMIFETDIGFEIELTETRGKAGAEFYVTEEIDGKKEFYKPELSRGGGVVDSVSLALRIAFLLKLGDLADGPLMLDEPAKHLSDDFIIQIAEFLKQISRMTGRQILFVTHNVHLAEAGDATYFVDKKMGQSEVIVSELDSLLHEG